MTKHISTLTAVLILLGASHAHAFREGDFLVGAMAGHVGLMGDVAARSNNAVGFGVLGGYAPSDELIFEMGYLGSAHRDLTHREITVGADYYLGGYDALNPQIVAGVAFLGNTLTDSGVDYSSTGFGLYAGAGCDVELGRNVSAGLQARYNKAFETTVKLANGTTIKAIEDNVTVMLRLMMAFGGGR